MTRKENQRYKELKELFESFTTEDFQKEENKSLIEEWYVLNGKYFNSVGCKKTSHREVFI